jgi:cytidylate kinase
MGKSDIITIDGPSAAGKSTLAKALARRLGWTFLDTGAIYRSAGLLAMEKGLLGAPGGILGGFVRGLGLRVVAASEGSRVFWGDRELTASIRSPEVSKAASLVSSAREVREALAGIQADLGAGGRLVSEGRDQGTAVFPHARLKFFLTADAWERARRRFKELSPKDPTLTLEEVHRTVLERDRADEGRAEAPLRPAGDAVLLDSTGLDQGEVLRIMEAKARELFDSRP